MKVRFVHRLHITIRLISYNFVTFCSRCTDVLCDIHITTPEDSNVLSLLYKTLQLPLCTPLLSKFVSTSTSSAKHITCFHHYDPIELQKIQPSDTRRDCGARKNVLISVQGCSTRVSKAGKTRLEALNIRKHDNIRLVHHLHSTVLMISYNFM